VPGAGAWQPGTSPALKSGLRTRQPSPIVLDPIKHEIQDALEVDSPLRDPNGGVPAADTFMIELCAIQLLRVRRCAAFLALHGDEDGRGNLRREFIEYGKAVEQAARMLDRLGMSPRSRAALGVDVSKITARPDPSTIISLAREETDPGIKRELLRSIGIGGDGG